MIPEPTPEDLELDLWREYDATHDFEPVVLSAHRAVIRRCAQAERERDELLEHQRNADDDAMRWD